MMFILFAALGLLIKKCLRSQNWKLLVLPILCLMVTTGWTQRPTGKIISYKESYYSVHEDFGLIKKSDKLDDPNFHDQFVTFDKSGNVIQATEYNADGTIYCTFTARCDYQNNNYETWYYRSTLSKDLDKKPFILQSVKYSMGKLFEMKYTNDSTGQPIEEKISDILGNELLTINFTWDMAGKPLEEKLSNGSFFRYFYDSQGHMVESIKGAHGDTTKTIYKHDNHGNISEMVIDNFYKSRYKYKYDQYRFKYRYDAIGNWVKRTDYLNDQPLRIVIRELKYEKK